MILLIACLSAIIMIVIIFAYNIGYYRGGCYVTKRLMKKFIERIGEINAK